MSFRLRVTLLATAAVAIAVVAASAVVYVVVRHQLLGEVDASLVDRAHDFVRNPGSGPGPDLGIVRVGPQQSFGTPNIFLQVISSTGEGAVVPLPGLDHAKTLAREGGRGFFSEGHVESAGGGDVHVRVYALQLGEGFALQAARPLDEVDRTLHTVGLYLIFISLGGVGIASGL